LRKEKVVGQRGRKKPNRLGEKLLVIRLKLGVSQSQLAKLLEFDKGVARISEYENGNREPNLTVLLKYARVARVSLEMLVDDNLELKFPKSWKIPRSAKKMLMREKDADTARRVKALRTRSSKARDQTRIFSRH
jgi:transcriptional regulator with XRE-family HTH domain